MGIHIWKYLDLHSAYIIVGFGLKWNSYAGTLTTKRVARLVMLYMREHMYATMCAVRNKFFLSLWGRTERACIIIIINQYLHCSSPYKFLTRLCNSYPLCPYLTKSCTCWWYRWQHQLDVRISWWFLEHLPYCGEFYTLWGTMNCPFTIGLKSTWKDSHGTRCS